jgi:hypothetical protein
MRFTVVWRPWAEQLLAEIWLASNDRNAIALAADQIDWELRRSPASKGESRDPGTRVLIVPPLTVAFEVNEEDRTVTVLSVRSRG